MWVTLPNAHGMCSQSSADGEAVKTTGFHALRNRRRVREVVLYAFDLIRHDGEGLRNLPLIDRKRRLAS